MKKIKIIALTLLFGVSLCFGQSSTPAVGHGAFPVRLTKTLDSSKLKEGDIVEAETSGSFKLADGTLVLKGSKLMGHVIASKSRAKGDSDSELTVAFDKLNVTDGKQLTVKGMVQAVFPSSEEHDFGANAMPTAAAGGSTRGGGVGGTNATTTSGESGSNLDSSVAPQPIADPHSVGVHDMHDLQLDNGVLTSKGKQVKLGTGVRLIVHVDILG